MMFPIFPGSFRFFRYIAGISDGFTWVLGLLCLRISVISGNLIDLFLLKCLKNSKRR